MIKVPKDFNEAVGLGGKLLWWAGRLRLVGIAIGVGGTIAVQLLTGFWTFRSEHQAIIRAQYVEALEAHKAFQRQIERFNAVFEGMPVTDLEKPPSFDEAEVAVVQEIREAHTYDVAAQAYIREINEISRLLPATEDEVVQYIDAISTLTKYYKNENPPEVGSLDWVVFFGEFRRDLDRYIATRDAFLSDLAGEVGSYWRAIRNS